MANDLNRCEFIGRLGADPEVRYTPANNAVANVRIACNWKSRDSEGVEWVSLVFFGKLAEIVGEYLKKGSRVFVAGRMQTRKWQGQDGQDRYTTEVVVNELLMLDGKPQEQQGGYLQDEARREQGRQRERQGGPVGEDPGFDDKDIPF